MAIVRDNSKGEEPKVDYLLIFTFAMENRQIIKNRYQYDKVQIEDKKER